MDDRTKPVTNKVAQKTEGETVTCEDGDYINDYLGPILMVIIGLIFMGQSAASWFGYYPPYNWAASMACGIAAVELGILKLRKKL